jgi:hypothetical protein
LPMLKCLTQTPKPKPPKQQLPLTWKYDNACWDKAHMFIARSHRPLITGCIVYALIIRVVVQQTAIPLCYGLLWAPCSLVHFEMVLMTHNCTIVCWGCWDKVHTCIAGSHGPLFTSSTVGASIISIAAWQTVIALHVLIHVPMYTKLGIIDCYSDKDCHGQDPLNIPVWHLMYYKCYGSSCTHQWTGMCSKISVSRRSSPVW